MTTKLTSHRYFWIVLLIALTACAPTSTINATNVQNTAISAARTDVWLTQTALPTATPLSLTFTPTAAVVVIQPTPYPTQPSLPIFTPDAMQVELWKEYQTELAKALFTYNPAIPQAIFGPDEYKDALCEWDILEQSGQEMYVWAECASADDLRGSISNPAVIYLEPDGSIREVKVPNEEINRNSQLPIYDLHLFSIDVQEKLCLYYFIWVPQCNSIIPNYVSLVYVPFDRRRESALDSHLK